MRSTVRHFPATLIASIGTAAALIIFSLAAPAGLVAQDADATSKAPDPAQTLRGHQGALLQISVVNADGKPIERQALIRLHSVLQDTTSWQSTADNAQTLFYDLLFGKYDIEASALGYLSSKAQVDVATVGNTIELKMVLQRDSMVDLEASDTSLPSKTIHEMNRAVRALNINDLQDAQKRLDEADKLSPASVRVKYLQGYLYLAKGDLEQAQTVLVQATTTNPHYVRALSLLGRVYLMRGQTDKAVATLEQGIAAGPDYWVTHALLADAYLAQHEYAKARQQAELAIENGDGEATVAQLALGEALANQGKYPESIAALKIFLSHNPKSIAVQHAQELLRKVEQYKSKPNEVWPDYERQVAAFDVANDMVVSAKAELPPTTWLPAGVDRNKPPVVTGLACPDQQVIEGAGDRVRELVTNVEKFAAIESITYERMDDAGVPSFSETHKFDYAAAVSQKPDVVLVDEYRVQRYDMNTLPDHIVDNGFAVLALVFHPVMRDAFKMTCEGLGEWHGKPTWLVRFQQREDKANHMQAYLMGTVKFPVSLKGRAWIAADTFQILRIESDMVKPMPVIELQAEHIVTEYAPVPFRKKSTEYWLPQSAEVYMHFRGQRYYRKHTFEKYMLFSVDAQDKVHEAKHDPEIPKSRNPKKHKWFPA